MERKENGLERETKKQEFMVKKLKRGVLVGKRTGPSTPPPTWRLEFTSPIQDNKKKSNSIAQEFLNIPTSAVSARKLCASLWEIQPHHISLAKMQKGRVFKHKLKRFELPTHVVDPPNSTAHPDQVAPYNPAVTPTSSLDFKGKLCESSYNLKTSTELLKVLNQIWSLEEQHASNTLLVKDLKMELDLSLAKIKELLKEKQAGRQEMDDLMKQVAEEKLVRKNKEQDRIKSAIQSVRDELEDERKLRKHSESLHRKLAQDLSELRSTFSNVLKELERERKARILLENLCDEFAKGIRDYEEEVRSLRHKPDTHHVYMNTVDRLILHISEAWFDERMQMKTAEAQNNLSEKSTIVDKLSLDIENFLQAKRYSKSKMQGNLSTNEPRKNCSYSHSLESFPLNKSASDPQDAANEEYSTNVDSQCFQLDKRGSRKQCKGSSKRDGNNARKGHTEELVNSNSGKKKVGSREKNKGRNMFNLQAQFSELGEIDGATKEEGGLHEVKNKHGTDGLNSNHVLDELIRNHSLSSEGDKIHPETDLPEDSCVQSLFMGHASPVQKWMSKLTSPDFGKSESSLKLPGVLKENTLKAKLLEARLESQQSRSKASKSSF